MNERFVYVSSLGFCALWAYLFLDRLPSWQSQYSWVKPLGLGILLLTAIGYAGKTIERVPAWKDAMSLNRAAIKVSTNSARANSYMAYALYQRGLKEQGAQQLATYQEALPLVNRALEIYPTYSDALTCKGGLVAGLYQQNNDLEQLLQGFYEILSARHIIFIDQYMEYLNGRVDGQRLAQFYHRTGYELMAQQQKLYPLALQYLNYGLGVSPNNVTILEDLAEVYALSGNPNMAQQMAQRALQVNPQSSRARAVLQ
jgi:tetratricopeptide (TPR) repeat protein